MKRVLCLALCLAAIFITGCGEIHYTVETTINGESIGTSEVTVRYLPDSKETETPKEIEAKRNKKETEIALSKMDSITVDEYDDGDILVILFLSGLNDDMEKIDYDHLYLYLLTNVIFRDLYGSFSGTVGGYVSGFSDFSIGFRDGEIYMLDVPKDVVQEWLTYSNDEQAAGLHEYADNFNKISSALGFGERYS